ncbi:MAG: hypothetical protein H0Z37_09315 [Firmicutes bacterium]|nr:hypothetical protein [Bacillota bacterium]
MGEAHGRDWEEGDPINGEQERLLARLTDPADLAVGRQVLEVALSAHRDDVPRATCFLDPDARAVAEGILAGVDGVRWFAAGGYPGARRRRIVVMPDYFPEGAADPPVAAVRLTAAHQLTERAAVGAAVKAGIAPEDIGDAVPASGVVQLLVTPEAASRLVSELGTSRGGPVSAQAIDLEQLEWPGARVREIRGTVASARLDAVAALAFSASRTRMARDIRATRIKLNWQVVTNPAAPVREGDVIALGGRGRAVVEKLSGPTRSGRIGITVRRYG